MISPLQTLTRQAFTEGARRWAASSPLYAALCRGLAESSALLALIQTYVRVTAVQAIPVDNLLAGLHRLALAGDAPELAAHFPTCGAPASATIDEVALLAAAEGALEEQSSDLLDALLTPPPPPTEPDDGAALAAATRLLAERWGGGFTLVGLGDSCDLALRFDQRNYAGFPGPFPAVVGRYGLVESPLDLSSPYDLLWASAHLAPEDRAGLERLRVVAATLSTGPAVQQRRGELLPLLQEAYAAMPRGNTLLLFSLWYWQGLTGGEREAYTRDLQRLASRLEPGKFLAFLQLDRYEGAPAELRLQTFHWRDPEERTVERIATYIDRRVGWLS
jgi:hypothetical protein